MQHRVNGIEQERNPSFDLESPARAIFDARNATLMTPVKIASRQIHCFTASKKQDNEIVY
jgi:hypothetical protein